MGQAEKRAMAAVRAALLAAVLCAGMDPAARAQQGPPAGGGGTFGQGPGHEQVQLELERTDALVERAGQEVAEARNTYAEERLRKARSLQRQAWGEFLHGTGAGLRTAHNLTRSARSMALQAIEAAGIEKRAHEAIGTMIERAQDRAAQISATLARSTSPLARRLFEQGLQQLARARRALKEGDPRAARLATLAQHLIERAERAATGSGAALQAAETSVERAETLLAEATARWSEEGSPEAVRPLLDEGHALGAQARKALGEGHPGLAFRLSASAREKALHVLARLRRLPSVEELTATLDDVEALYEEMAGRIVAGPAGAQAGKAFEHGRELLAKTRGLLGSGKLEEALAALVAAESLLRRAVEDAQLE